MKNYTPVVVGDWVSYSDLCGNTRIAECVSVGRMIVIVKVPGLGTLPIAHSCIRDLVAKPSLLTRLKLSLLNVWRCVC